MPIFCYNCGFENKDDPTYCNKCGVVLQMPDSFHLLQPDTILDKRYKITKLIKRGGMGSVYKAVDTRLNNICAVKELPPTYGSQQEQLQSIKAFKRESEILAKLDHPNLPKVYDYFVSNDGRYYLIMNFIDGEDLETILHREENSYLSEKDVIEYTKQILSILDYLHSQEPPVIYRDIKPSNIMLNKDGRVMLIDFGIARTIQQGSQTTKTVIGTLGYSPVEQYKGKVEPRSDIYSLGATIHHLLTGLEPVPFKFEPLRKINQNVSPDLENIVMKALKDRVEERFSCAKEMLGTLLQIGVKPQPTKALHQISKVTSPQVVAQSASPGQISLPTKVIPMVKPKQKSFIEGVMSLFGATSNSVQPKQNVQIATPQSAVRTAVDKEVEVVVVKTEHIRKEIENKTKELEILLQASQEFVNSLRLEDTYEVIIRMINKLVSCQTCIVFLIKDVEGEPQLVAEEVTGPYREYVFTVKTFPISSSETIVGWVATEKKPCIISDIELEKTPSPMIRYERSEMAVPLLMKEECIGVIYVGQQNPNAFTYDNINLLNTMANQFSVAVTNARLYEQTYNMAITDYLTGLYNQRYFQVKLEEGILKAQKYKTSMALVKVATDNLYTYNNTYGHSEGDLLLKEISKLLKGYARETDTICRYEGDEFTLILVEADKKTAINTAERIRQAIQLKLNQREVKITASIGVASYPEDATDKTELIGMVDASVYDAKHSGRNRVCYPK